MAPRLHAMRDANFCISKNGGQSHDGQELLLYFSWGDALYHFTLYSLLLSLHNIAEDAQNNTYQDDYYFY